MKNSMKKLWGEKREIDYSKVPESIGETIGYTQELVDQKTMRLLDQNCSPENLKVLKEREELTGIPETEIKAREKVIDELLIKHLKYNIGASNNSKSINREIALHYIAYAIIEKGLKVGDEIEYFTGGIVNDKNKSTIIRIDSCGTIVLKNKSAISVFQIVKIIQKGRDGVRDTGENGEEDESPERKALELLKEHELDSIPALLCLISPSTLTDDKEKFTGLRNELCKILEIPEFRCTFKIIEMVFGKDKSNSKNILAEVYKHTVEIIGDSSFEELKQDTECIHVLRVYILALIHRYGDEYTKLNDQEKFQVYLKNTLIKE